MDAGIYLCTRVVEIKRTDNLWLDFPLVLATCPTGKESLYSFGTLWFELNVEVIQFSSSI